MLSSLLLFLNTVFWCIWLYPIVLIRFLLPFRFVRKFCNKIILWIAETWIAGNGLNINWTQNIKWDLHIETKLDPNKSYLVTANHQSWFDITILQYVLNQKVPFLRFFLKQELIYVPFLGTAWIALDYPFMKRYSKEYLQKHPEKRGEDLKTAREALEKFKGRPVSILNFLEGTRFTQDKHKQQNSPYKYLLLPKAGGLASTLETLNNQISSVLDVTIVYPYGPASMWEALNGKLKHVIVHIREISLPFDFSKESYSQNAEFRDQVQNWVQDIWKQKDEKIKSLLS